MGRRSDHARAGCHCFQEDGAVDDLVLVNRAEAVPGERVKGPFASVDSCECEAIARISRINVFLWKAVLIST